jgi:acyl-CoA synthetase (AMP-forming)/AMP-acid ligase II
VLDGEGWFHTGDIVEYDDEWYFYVRDRKKDMIISGGENVYPLEIEQVIYKHPAVLMCAVVGLPDPRWGEAGKACVVLREGQTASEGELFDLMREHLAPYKIPKSITFMDALPLSGMGKILKRELRDKYS